MQNTNIMYHMESIVEMQLISTIVIWLVWSLNQNKNESIETEINILIIILLFLHFITYFFALFRAWEIDHHGKIDVNGIERGPIETNLRSIEIFMNCIMVGYSTHFLLGTDHK